uniref:Cytochrome P450 n=1 Tax=Kalanchoe fedtschenkoi TaxID=63787 RepID=A0A7N0TPP8_KALFE
MDVSQFLQRLHSTRSAAVTTVVEVAIGALFLILVRNLVRKRRLKSPPAVPGWPLIGNLLEMNEKEPPHLTFSRLAERYGPIYRLRLGSTTLFVLNSIDVAKERRHRVHRDFMVENMVRRLHEHVKSHPLEPVDFRKIFQSEIFRLSVKEVSKCLRLVPKSCTWSGGMIGADVQCLQAFGREVESLYVEELGATLSSEEQYQVLVTDVMEGSGEVDWRDFFPYLRWIPNSSVETKLQRLFFRREVVLTALINVQKKRIASEKVALNLYGCNRDKKYWEKPEQWNPEGLLDDKREPVDLYRTMSFGAGKRACAGAYQAMLISCTSIGRLVQEFSWLTTHKLNPPHVLVKPIDPQKICCPDFQDDSKRHQQKANCIP